MGGNRPSVGMSVHGRCTLGSTLWVENYNLSVRRYVWLAELEREEDGGWRMEDGGWRMEREGNGWMDR